ncbi:hypothetical protein [Catenulispora yoronensis]|uniref:hypothetical protein n=1 Tax=Catenulispora yoronensis TaxID=450799 RepID=UPI0031E41B9F
MELELELGLGLGLVLVLGLALVLVLSWYLIGEFVLIAHRRLLWWAIGLNPVKSQSKARQSQELGKAGASGEGLGSLGELAPAP